MIQMNDPYERSVRVDAIGCAAVYEVVIADCWLLIADSWLLEDLRDSKRVEERSKPNVKDQKKQKSQEARIFFRGKKAQANGNRMDFIVPSHAIHMFYTFLCPF
jgi:hypothetical protein